MVTLMNLEQFAAQFDDITDPRQSAKVTYPLFDIPRIQVRSATLRHLSSHAHFLEYDGGLLKA